MAAIEDVLTAEESTVDDTVKPIPSDPGHRSSYALLSWLEDQPSASRTGLAEKTLENLVKEATSLQDGSFQGCIKMCGFVQQCTKSHEADVSQWAFSEVTALKLFNFFLEWNEHSRHRSLKLIPEALVVLISRNPMPEAAAAVKSRVLDRLVSIIARRSTQPQAKSAYVTLHFFLNKSTFSMEDLLGSFRAQQPTAVTSGNELAAWKSFVQTTFSWMNVRHVCQMAGRCLALIFRNLYVDLKAFSLDVWYAWLFEAVTAGAVGLEDIKIHVFGTLFKLDRAVSLDLLSSFNRRELGRSMADAGLNASALLQLAALEVGKKAGLVKDPDDVEGQAANAIAVDEVALDPLFAHPSHEIRSTAFVLVVSSPSTTKPFSNSALRLLQKHLAAFHCDFDVKFRYDMLSQTKHVIWRVKAVISTNRQSDAASGILRQHESFFSWYLNFLKGELVPTASYQRHITALKSLSWVLSPVRGDGDGLEKLQTDSPALRRLFYDSSLIRLLLDLVLDAFSDVREEASARLMQLCDAHAADTEEVRSKMEFSELKSLVGELCRKAQAQAQRSSRADHGDGAARSYGILCQCLSRLTDRMALIEELLQGLENKLVRAKDDLGHAVTEHAVHGDFASLRYVWEVVLASRYSEKEVSALQQLQTRAVRLCRRVWAIVEPILCDDSPEGLLPEEMEDVEGLGTKDLLSYSFRAVHESSNFMRGLIMPLRPSQCASGDLLVPSVRVFEDIGSLAFEQLAKLRHRGAFSTVALTFTTCCQLANNLVNVGAEQTEPERLLKTWYEGALSRIRNEASTTRRSAGIPALIAGILAANARDPSFEAVFQQLCHIAARPAPVQAAARAERLPQVHALNCLKEAFKSSLLCKRAEPFLPQCLQLAASSLQSEIWAIRNCALILFRSLIDYLIGSTDDKSTVESGWDGHTVRISYSRYPSLPGLLSRLLQAKDVPATAAAEAVFPALDIIRRAGPPDELRGELYGYIAAYTGSPLWHVREMAARTLCSFLLCPQLDQEDDGDWVAAVEGLLGAGRGSANRLHGALLTAKFVLARKVELAAPLTEEVKEDAKRLELVANRLVYTTSQQAYSAEIKAACLEVLNIAAPLTATNNARSNSLQISTRVSPKESGLSYRGSTALLRARLAVGDVLVAARENSVRHLQEAVFAALGHDIDTASMMLEKIPLMWTADALHAQDKAGELCQLYLSVCIRTQVTEPRRVALLNLAMLMVGLLAPTVNNALPVLPSDEQLQQVWALLASGPLNPGLFCAILTVSGPIMATLHLRSTAQEDNTSPPTPGLLPRISEQLQAWGAMMRTSLAAENTFDTRMAATAALQSFWSAVGSLGAVTAGALPVLLAVYDALNDDDDEIRAVAARAAAAASSTAQPLVAAEAATAFLAWLVSQADAWPAPAQAAFCREALCRMAGGDPDTAPAEEQLAPALVRNDALFAVEEQNLFVDEVREAQRWADVFLSLGEGGRGNGDPALLLARWAEDGLRCLVRLVERQGDGPLGWSSEPRVFAVCARVLICAGAARAACAPGEDGGDVTLLLQEFVEKGAKAAVHGLLLDMARGQASLNPIASM